jgi:hypothetical protein
MAATTNSHIAALPVEVVLRQDEVAAPRFTPRELRMIKDHLGRTFTQVLTDDDSDDKFTVMAWLKLRRDGVELDWDDMDDVIITIGGSAPDPTNAQPSTTSPRSASSGE